VIGAYRVKPTGWEANGPVPEDTMTTKLRQRGWTAAEQLASCVLCHQPAIMRSPRGKPCHWTCALAWADEHQGQDHEHGVCPACKGGGLVPAPGCRCQGTAHTCTPMICTVCHGTGRSL
jgi:hypothetical protein